jgi:very-short-patch-repair endonuclease
MLLMLGGLPRPEAQVDLHTPEGAFVGRADLYYPDASVAVEFDGENHRERLVSDDRRQNRFHDIGVVLLRYTAPDLSDRRTAIVAEVSAALRRGRKGQSVHTMALQRAG